MSLTDWTRDEIHKNDNSTVKDVRSLLHSLTGPTDEELSGVKYIGFCYVIFTVCACAYDVGYI